LSNLRIALDLVAIGTLANLAPTSDVHRRWKNNSAALAFPDCRQNLRKLTAEPAGGLLFKQGGGMENFYYELGAYAHSRPEASDGAMWQSNGPVYVGAASVRVFGCQTATYAWC